MSIAEQPLLGNSGFEDETSWLTFGNAVFPVFADPNDPQTPDKANSGTHVGKLSGRYTGNLNVSGLYQQFPAQPGETFKIDSFSYVDSDDPLTGQGVPDSNWVVMKIAFFDEDGFEIGGFERTIADGTIPKDQWIDNQPVTGIAPPGTVVVGAYILFLQPGLDSGSVFVDDVYFARMETETIAADSLTTFRGILISGGLEDTLESDDSYVKYQPGITLVQAEPPVWLVFNGTLPTSDPNSMSVTLEASANSVGLSQSIEMFNWTTGQYEQVDARAAEPNTDTVVTIDVSSDTSDFVDPETGAVQSRMGWRATGPVLLFPWTVSVDQVVWTITQ